MANNLRYTIYAFIILSFFGSMMIACTTERNPCLEPIVPKLTVGCYQYKTDTKTYVDTALPNVNFVSFDIDSAHFWYWGANSLNKFSLVLSPLKDSARWIIQPDSGFSQKDTITFVYERKLKFYSNACGYGYTYVLQKALSTTKNIDSVRIFNNEVTTKAGVENVKIYF